MSNDQANKKRLLFYYSIAWIVLGLVLSMAAYYTYQNNFNKVSFSSTNDIYYVDNEIFTNEKIVDEEYWFATRVYPDNYNINYLRVSVLGAKDGTSKISFVGTKDMGDGQTEEKVVLRDIFLQNGNNDIKLPNQNFDVAVWEFTGAKGMSIKEITFLERIEEKPVCGGLVTAGAVLLAYFFITVAALLFLKKKGLSCCDEITCMDISNKEISMKKLPVIFGNWSQRVRIVAYFLIIVVSLLMAIQGEGSYKKHFEIYFTIQMSLSLILILSIPDNNHPFAANCSKDNFLILVWAALTLYTLASDIFVKKNDEFVWLGIFALMMSLSSVWCCRVEDGRYIKDFVIAVQLSLIIILLLGIIVRPEVYENRYSGPFTNPSIYGLYLGAIWSVLLGALDNLIYCKGPRIGQSLIISEMLITLCLLALSKSVTPIIAVGVVTGLWAFRLISKKKGLRFAIWTVIIVCLLGAAGLVALVMWASGADEIGNSRIISKLQSGSLTTILSGRNYYWKRYYSQLNLLGHSKKPFLWDHRILPHNALLKMAYWYGVPVVIPYILMMMMSVEKAYRFAGTKVSYSSVPLYCIVTFVIMSMTDNVEQPFVWLPWIACYFMMAPILVRSVEDIERLKIADYGPEIKGDISNE